MHIAPSLDLQTIGHLYEGHHGWLVGWLRRRLGCPHNAADLAQDTFTRIIVRREALYLQEARALLTTVAQGLVVDHFRRAALEKAFLEALALLPEEQAPSEEARLILLETIGAVDRMLDGCSYAQIASELKVSLSSVQQYMTRAFTACYAAAGEA